MKVQTTLEEIKQLPPNTIFATGVVENSPEGIYLTDNRIGDKLLWIANRGLYHDWCIYTYWLDDNVTVKYVAEMGQKVTDLKNVEKLIDCDEAMMKMYRL